MNKIIHVINDALRTSLGQPVHVERFLAAHPEFKAPLVRRADNIFLSSVPKWQLFGESGTGIALRRAKRSALMGWHREGSRYCSFNASCPVLSQLVKHAVVEKWHCDLQDLHGFAASKSDLKKFASMDDMVETNSREMIQDISAAGLQENLAHDQIRITDANRGSDWFEVAQWDGRMFVVNDGGSHHLAAAKYIASRIDALVPLSAPLHYYSVDPGAVATLRAEYDVYVVNNHHVVANAFFKAMESSGTTWLWHALPAPYWGEKAIFLPRAEPLSMRVSQAFKDAGFEELGAYLEEVAHSHIPEVISKYLPSEDLPSDVDVEEERIARYG